MLYDGTRNKPFLGRDAVRIKDESKPGCPFPTGASEENCEEIDGIIRKWKGEKENFVVIVKKKLLWPFLEQLFWSLKQTAHQFDKINYTVTEKS